MELGETLEQGAIREAVEEANAEIQIKRILAVFSLRHISLVQVNIVSLHPWMINSEEGIGYRVLGSRVAQC